jgi:hypothetical protein
MLRFAFFFFLQYQPYSTQTSQSLDRPLSTTPSGSISLFRRNVFSYLLALSYPSDALSLLMAILKNLICSLWSARLTFTAPPYSSAAHIPINAAHWHRQRRIRSGRFSPTNNIIVTSSHARPNNARLIS